MTKNKKKRNKQYTGTDAAITQPTVTRISAVSRTKGQQWWFDNKKRVKTVAIFIGVVIVISLTLIEIVRLLIGR